MAGTLVWSAKTHRQTNKQTNKQTNRKTEKQNYIILYYIILYYIILYYHHYYAHVYSRKVLLAPRNTVPGPLSPLTLIL